MKSVDSGHLHERSPPQFKLSYLEIFCLPNTATSLVSTSYTHGFTVVHIQIQLHHDRVGMIRQKIAQGKF